MYLTLIQYTQMFYKEKYILKFEIGHIYLPNNVDDFISSFHQHHDF